MAILLCWWTLASRGDPPIPWCLHGMISPRACSLTTLIHCSFNFNFSLQISLIVFIDLLWRCTALLCRPMNANASLSPFVDVLVGWNSWFTVITNPAGSVASSAYIVYWYSFCRVCLVILSSLSSYSIGAGFPTCVDIVQNLCVLHCCRVTSYV